MPGGRCSRWRGHCDKGPKASWPGREAVLAMQWEVTGRLAGASSFISVRGQTWPYRQAGAIKDFEIVLITASISSLRRSNSTQWLSWVSVRHRVQLLHKGNFSFVRNVQMYFSNMFLRFLNFSLVSLHLLIWFTSYESYGVNYCYVKPSSSQDISIYFLTYAEARVLLFIVPDLHLLLDGEF